MARGFALTLGSALMLLVSCMSGIASLGTHWTWRSSWDDTDYNASLWHICSMTKVEVLQGHANRCVQVPHNPHVIASRILLCIGTSVAFFALFAATYNAMFQSIFLATFFLAFVAFASLLAGWVTFFYSPLYAHGGARGPGFCLGIVAFATALFSLPLNLIAKRQEL
eukprot:TRINITY_DN31294_c0_g1_i1.p1 TRINITY_DN31294_c0_g1~~TRINITY_DN31294_c0_g1_i1.p1  ORF type:complete len:167 (+),score=13.82 TRINITY_DN31294_c0_g1_i1:73-573(+)